ncbi:hypothetical protein [Campylobacter sp. MIT 97-5078]|uniref:hypothetical protein n=1 Tax=Campylobacter sp. MIT 97-5078 TaxID=1548153 RepID=UPI000514870C|nr:hypothetical protein [Campylobacter sp. MIT 97-5078]KGI56964.1 hypothetical protein LR59_03775 [Campylobacter sp. MIT 97-5078]
MMKILLFCAVLLFLSCSKPLSITDELRAQGLIHTQKQRVVQNEHNFIFLLTYLNPILDEPSKDELFLLSITPKTDEISDITISLDQEQGELSLLKEDDELLKYVFTNEYSSYYKLSFKEKNTSVLKLNLCVKDQCFELNFQKYSKSLYYRSVDVDTQYN